MSELTMWLSGLFMGFALGNLLWAGINLWRLKESDRHLKEFENRLRNGLL